MSNDNDILQNNNASDSNNKPDNIHVRRVGTFTMGISLILVGAAIIISFINPSFNVLTAAKLSPVILIFVGIEIIIASILNKSDRIKYDFLSGVVCFILICGSLLASCLLYSVPAHEVLTNKLSDQIYDECYSVLKDEKISDLHVNTYMVSYDYDKDITLENSKSWGTISLNIELIENYNTPEIFAQKSKDILNKLNTTDISFDNIIIEYEDYETGSEGYRLELNDRLKFNMTAEELEKYVES